MEWLIAACCQTSSEVEDPSPRYVHIPELVSLKPDKVGQADQLLKKSKRRPRLAQEFPIEAPTERTQLLAALELLQTWVSWTKRQNS